MAKISWVKAYRQLAELLVNFYGKNPDNCNTLLFEMCYARPDFFNLNPWMKKFREVDPRPGLDPVVVFACFSGQHTNEAKRIGNINILLDLLGNDGSMVRLEEIDFDGCPMPRMSKILSHRKKSSQNELWALFVSIFEKGRSGLTRQAFEQYRQWFGINIPSLTIFLFWVDSRDFLALDNHTTSYLLNEKLITRPVSKFDEYITLLDRTKGMDYVEMSREAYLSRPPAEEAEIISQQIERPKTTAVPPGPPAAKPVIGEFKLVALRVFEQTPEKYRKVIDVNRLYQFSQAYALADDAFVGYDPGKDVRLYNAGDLSVSISAIVGKNGSGKSTIAELIYLALNNLAEQHKSISSELQFVDGVTMELFYAAEYFYRIALIGKDIKVYRYEPLPGGYGNKTVLTLDEFNLGELFYTVSVNYSHFALNPNHIGKWIDDLFHKNDAYQAPVVINPHRTDGNIDVNIEEYFGNSRLIANILSSDGEDAGPGRSGMFRQITDDLKAVSIELSFDSGKMRHFLYQVSAPTAKEPNRIRYGQWEKAAPYWRDFVRTLENVFNILPQTVISEPMSALSWTDEAYRYALKKAISISFKYDRYEGAYNFKKDSFKNLRKYLEDLRDDASHVTFKFKQAVNFIKHDHIRKRIGDKAIFKITQLTVAALAEDIDIIIQREQDKNLGVIHLIPPPFFKSEIILEKGIRLSDLSSGEKQRIFAISTIAYHLLNINSKMAQDDLIAYRFVNIIFDEVELYFHPDMQRTFIDYLLKYIGFLPVEQLRGLNIIFITHSPFILSDIPACNIMFLGTRRAHWNTFGANIHDMLADSFFLHDGVMGEFGKNTILSLSDFLSGKKPQGDFIWTRENALDVIKLVGEPLIKQRLEMLYFKRFSPEDRKTRMEALKLELNRLENEEDI